MFNGSFELGSDPGISININAPNSTLISGWTVATGSVDYIGTRWVSADGFRCIDLSGETAGSLLQSVSGFEVGALYQLSFMLAGNPEAPPFTKSVRVSIGDTAQNFTFAGAGGTIANLGWTQRTLDFTASDTSMNLIFASLTPGTSGPALDAVSIVLVPEPGALALARIPAIWIARRTFRHPASGRPR